MRCIYCGVNNPDTNAFCKNCGRQLRAARQDTSPSRFPQFEQGATPVRSAPLPPLPRVNTFPELTSVPNTPALPASPPSPEPPTPQRTRTANRSNARNGLLLAIGVILLLVLLAGVTMFLLSHSFATSSDPTTQTLTNYCNALKKRDYQSAWALWSGNMQNQMKESDFAYSWASRGNISSCSINASSTNGSSCTTTACTGTITFFLDNSNSITDTLQLVLENDQWKIQSESASS